MGDKKSALSNPHLLFSKEDFEKLNSKSVVFEYMEYLLENNKWIYFVYYIYGTPCHYILMRNDFTISLQVIVSNDKLNAQQGAVLLSKKIKKMVLKKTERKSYFMFFNKDIEFRMILQ